MGATGDPIEGQGFAVLLTLATISEACSIAAALVNIMGTISYQSQEENDTATGVQDMGATAMDTALWTERIKQTLVFLARVVAGGLPLTYITYGIIHVVHANRTHILGDENILSYGQFIPVVTLVASFYKMWDSYRGNPFLPS